MQIDNKAEGIQIQENWWGLDIERRHRHNPRQPITTLLYFSAITSNEEEHLYWFNYTK